MQHEKIRLAFRTVFTLFLVALGVTAAACSSNGDTDASDDAAASDG
ncbi:MAG: hypothetical protein AAFX79_10235 [Planctomycetota bacterium]